MLYVSMFLNMVLLYWCWRLDDKIEKLEDMLSVLTNKPLKIHEDDQSGVIRFRPIQNGEVQE